MVHVSTTSKAAIAPMPAPAPAPQPQSRQALVQAAVAAACALAVALPADFLGRLAQQFLAAGNGRHLLFRRQH